jgi:hypothetical protein
MKRGTLKFVILIAFLATVFFSVKFLGLGEYLYQ